MFKTKKELLEHLGKKGNDNKLVDRLMLKGIVEKVDGGYILHDPQQEEIARQQEEIERLKGIIDKLEMDNESLEILIRDLEEKNKKSEEKEKKSEKKDDKISSSSINSEKSDLEFAIEEYDRISSVLVSSMKKCYNIFIQMKKIDPNQESFEVFYKGITGEGLNH